jgi:pimeloyl-ACP methyl ester carboxylesterase
MAQEAAPALARETFAWTEFVQLLADPVYYGAGVPRGDGRLVLVLPGLFGNDWYLQPMRSWLNRIGYRAAPSTLPVNAGCPERLTRAVEASLERRVRRTGGPVAIIGHSRGGILARTIAARIGEDASHLILLGSDRTLERLVAGVQACGESTRGGCRQQGETAAGPRLRSPILRLPVPNGPSAASQSRDEDYVRLQPR